MGVVNTCFELITEQSAEDGDAAELGFLAHQECTVDEVIKLVRGCEPSSTEFHVGVWYTQYGEMDPISGDTENLSYHLARGEWSEAEERFIYEQVVGK